MLCLQPLVSIKTKSFRDFHGGLVVQTPCFHCRGLGFDLWLGGLRPCMLHSTAVYSQLTFVYSQLIFDKEAKNTQWEKDQFSNE